MIGSFKPFDRDEMVNWLWVQSRNEFTKKVAFTTLGRLPITYFSHENIPETHHEIDENEGLLEITSGTFFQLVESEKSQNINEMLKLRLVFKGVICCLVMLPVVYESAI